MTAADRVERDRDLERLLTFVDAVAAVAITLLVLPLVDLAGNIHSNHDSVWELIRLHSGQFWGFALSFLVIARLWLVQHELFRTVVAANQAVVTWLVFWTLSIVFLPFPTALLPQAGSEAATKILYIGTLALSSACITVLAVIIGRNRALRDRDERPPATAAATAAALFVAALIITLAVPAASYYPLLLLAVQQPTAIAYRFVRHRRASRA